MSHLTRREQVQAIITAEHEGQRYCPGCGTPLNYDRGRLPNSATFNPATDAVTCHRCKQSTSPVRKPAATTATPPDQPAPTGARLAYTSFTG